MRLHRFAFRAMACDNELQLAGEQEAATAMARRAMAEVLRIEAKYSRYRDDSVTTAINRSAGKAPVAIDTETAALLDFADALHGQSDGRFDLTSGVLRRAWDFKAARLPSESALTEALALVGWSKVERAAGQVFLPLAQMEIDFGGIGKEYAADRAAMVMAELGAQHGLVNLGGDVRVLGPAPDGRPWRIGIQDPRGETGRILAHLDVASGALATSGDYERYFELDGRRYCHLLDPRTGWPVEYWRSISVVAPLAVAAGGSATIAMLMPIADAIDFLQAQDLRYLAIDASGERHSH